MEEATYGIHRNHLTLDESRRAATFIEGMIERRNRRKSVRGEMPVESVRGEQIPVEQLPVTQRHETSFWIIHKYAVGDTLVWGDGERERTITAIYPSARIGGGNYMLGQFGKIGIHIVDENPHITLKPKETPLNVQYMVQMPSRGDVWSWKNEPRQDVHPNSAVCFKISGTVENPTIERVW